MFLVIVNRGLNHPDYSSIVKFKEVGLISVVFIQVPLVASNRVGKEIIETEHGNSEITFYGNSFIAGMNLMFLFFSGSLIIFINFTCLRKSLNINILMPGPTGEIIVAADDKEEAVLIAEFDLDKIKSKRSSWGVFRDRRPDLYKVLLTFDGSNPSS